MCLPMLAPRGRANWGIPVLQADSLLSTSRICFEGKRHAHNTRDDSSLFRTVPEDKTARQDRPNSGAITKRLNGSRAVPRMTVSLGGEWALSSMGERRRNATRRRPILYPASVTSGHGTTRISANERELGMWINRKAKKLLFSASPAKSGTPSHGAQKCCLLHAVT
jgi:hypothetical protein